MSIYQLGDDKPTIPASAYVAPEATVIGKVILGENASVWPGAVIRGDNESIRIGNGSNVQDNAVLHADPGFPLMVGENVTIGHQADAARLHHRRRLARRHSSRGDERRGHRQKLPGRRRRVNS